MQAMLMCIEFPACPQTARGFCGRHLLKLVRKTPFDARNLGRTGNACEMSASVPQSQRLWSLSSWLLLKIKPIAKRKWERSHRCSSIIIQSQPSAT